MSKLTWHLQRPYFDFSWSQRRQIHPLRDLIVLAILTCFLGLTFKREIKIARQKGWSGWRENAAQFIQEVTHPL